MANVNTMKLYAKYFLKKFRDHSFSNEGNLPEENIKLGETLDWSNVKEEQCPRIEFLVHSKQGAGEVSNIAQDENLTMTVAAYRWHEQNEFSEQDYFDMLDFMEDIENVVKEISAERAQGSFVSPDFLRLAAYTEIDVEPDFADYVGSGIMRFTIVLTKSNY